MVAAVLKRVHVTCCGQSGALRTIVAAKFPLAEIRHGFELLMSSRAKGKIVIQVAEE